MSEPAKTFGEVGYEAYAESTGGKTWDNRDMPKWSDLTPRIVAAWEAAGAAISAQARRASDEDLPPTERNA